MEPISQKEKATAEKHVTQGRGEGDATSGMKWKDLNVNVQNRVRWRRVVGGLYSDMECKDLRQLSHYDSRELLQLKNTSSISLN